MQKTQTISLDPKIVTQMGKEWMQMLDEKGLVIVGKNVANFSYKFYEERKKVLRKKWVTPHEIAKYDLMVNVGSYQTVKNMVADGRIGKNDHLYEKRKNTNVLKISVRFIKKFNEAA